MWLLTDVRSKGEPFRVLFHKRAAEEIMLALHCSLMHMGLQSHNADPCPTLEVQTVGA